MATHQKNTSGCKALRNVDNGWKGAETEARFIMECARRHWELARPLTDMHRFDFVIRRLDQWETVQVKRCYTDVCGSGAKRLAVSIRTTSGGKYKPYKAGDFDLLCAVDHHTDRIWLIPYKCISHLASNVALRQCECFLLGDKEPDFSDLDALCRKMADACAIPGNAKITFESADKIRLDHSAGESRDSLAKKHKVGKSTIARILTGKLWLKD